MDLLILTGMSGAGKHTAFNMLEDMGYYCVDNLPIPLLKSFVDLDTPETQGSKKVVVGIDSRNGESLTQLCEILEELGHDNKKVDVLFLDAEDEVLIKRYKETRRNHPLSGAERIQAGLDKEREALRLLKERADYIIDTSRLLTRELKEELEKIFLEKEEYKNLIVTVMSFGYKYGVPLDADLVFDVRFLPNPYYDLALRPLTGNDQKIRDFVKADGREEIFLDKLYDMIKFLMPNYIAEGKNQLVIAVGCTGGKHRSVTVANELYQKLIDEKSYFYKLEHRDITKDAARGK